MDAVEIVLIKSHLPLIAGVPDLSVAAVSLRLRTLVVNRISISTCFIP